MTPVAVGMLGAPFRLALFRPYQHTLCLGTLEMKRFWDERGKRKYPKDSPEPEDKAKTVSKIDHWAVSVELAITDRSRGELDRLYIT